MLIVSIHYLIKRKITNFIVIDSYFANLAILANLAMVAMVAMVAILAILAILAISPFLPISLQFHTF